MNQENFGKILGLSQDSISAIETGKNRPTIPVMQIMHKRWNVNLEWLMLGKGASFHHLPVPINEESILMLPLLNNQASQAKDSPAETYETVDYFPLSSTLFKGFQFDRLCVIRENSDSMEPVIFRGDYLVCEHETQNLSDGLYVLSRNGYLFSRRLYFRLDGKIQISPDNNRYPVEEISAADLKKLCIYGKIIWRIQQII
ncbi:MAG: hypothetical protein A2Y33_14975 [Spirochaetes bacterium GWF1_51_8]|nr:MAG: hypothetical protein A2Y33_14975 [Spirochaetes bacterium GWF1_51_8]